jgi:hypothetical protein
MLLYLIYSSVHIDTLSHDGVVDIESVGIGKEATSSCVCLNN